MKDLPSQVFYTGEGGSFTVATDRVQDIHKYVDQALACLKIATADDLGPHVRGGALRQADDYLDTVIRFAKCAKETLREADYSPH